MFSWLFLEAPRNLGIISLLLVGLSVAASLAFHGVRGQQGRDEEPAGGACPRCGGTGRLRSEAGDWPCLESVHRPADRS